jgi:hypothetical protein
MTDIALNSSMGDAAAVQPAYAICLSASLYVLLESVLSIGPVR